ncbi:hypothetical protein PVK06_002561 [Gossypium arboreum]|uniref:Uncharacterized protein n=1 Tax=Gossypium arboreum TaxID=29729 RepID=A0ABR0R5B3_GOSAR|nr:hypothetical protein PVK06_002561 [Gossypium arboreum]
MKQDRAASLNILTPLLSPLLPSSDSTNNRTAIELAVSKVKKRDEMGGRRNWIHQNMLAGCGHCFSVLELRV